MKWNLRLAAASRGIWKASELQKMLAGRGLVISAGKMSGLWSGNPNAVKLADLDVICAVLGCEIGELLVPEPVPDARPADDSQPKAAAAAAVPPSCPGAATAGPFPRRERRRPPAAARRAVPGEPCIPDVCRGCYDFARRHEPGPCGTCRRDRPLKEGYCRNCWLQAALQAAGTARRAPDLGPADFAAVSWHQLSFAGVARMTRRPRLPRPDEDPVPAGPPGPRWEQPELPAPGQSLRFHARHWTAASVSGPALEQARAIASRLGEARGWNPRVQEETRRALAVMLASHVPGEKIPWSVPGAGTAAPGPERLPRRGDPRPRRAARRRPRPSPGHVDRRQARHAGAGHRRLRPQLGHAPCSKAPRGPCPARPTPSGSTSAASARSWTSGPAATITCARSPPATSPRRSPPCAATSATRHWSRCGP